MKPEWIQILGTVVPIFIMFLWLLREFRSDNRALSKKIDAVDNRLSNKIDAVDER